MGTENYTMSLVGEKPLLMHNDRLLVDPLHPLFKEKAKIAAKPASKRTDEEERELRRLEWAMAFYFDDDQGGPIIPTTNITACLIQAGKATKHGTHVKRSVVVLDDLQLKYSGPRTKEELWDAGFEDTRPVNVGTGGQAKRIMRCRPCFPKWSGSVKVLLDTTAFDRADFKSVVERSGMVGLGDFRPTFGRFTATLKRGH